MRDDQARSEATAALEDFLDAFFELSKPFSVRLREQAAARYHAGGQS